MGVLREGKVSCSKDEYEVSGTTFLNGYWKFLKLEKKINLNITYTKKNNNKDFSLIFK
jgi:hypothetical protein